MPEECSPRRAALSSEPLVGKENRVRQGRQQGHGRVAAYAGAGAGRGRRSRQRKEPCHRPTAGRHIAGRGGVVLALKVHKRLPPAQVADAGEPHSTTETVGKVSEVRDGNSAVFGEMVGGPAENARHGEHAIAGGATRRRESACPKSMQPRPARRLHQSGKRASGHSGEGKKPWRKDHRRRQERAHRRPGGPERREGATSQGPRHWPARPAALPQACEYRASTGAGQASAGGAWSSFPIHGLVIAYVNEDEAVLSNTI